ncbi:MAG: M48 family metallopeptidase [Deltaproteobacteria bacterium]|nr:M48 family metallopeptidase [Deltaproteobacteria bacterium]
MGSFSAESNITPDPVINFNSELLDLDRAVGEYVIVHELLHFVVPHHGKLWKSLMRAYLGDYENLDEKLKRAIARESPSVRLT